MFEIAELGQKLSKADYQAKEKPLRAELVQLQHQLKSANFPVLVVFNGIEGGGKGETLYLLHEWFDPRFLLTHVTGKPTEEEAERPYFWQFWRAMPPQGRIGLFYGSWYARPLLFRLRGELSKRKLDNALSHANAFEEMLVADGALLLKFWFHLSKPALRERLRELKQDREKRWQVRPLDISLMKHYDRYRQMAELTLRRTNTGTAPWQLIEAADARFRNLSVAQHLRDRLLERMTPASAPEKPAPAEIIAPAPAVPRVSVLEQLNLTQSVTAEEYDREYPRLEAELFDLTRRAAKRKISSVLVFEGWDAAGKGGAIRRLVAPINPRNYRIIPVAAPTEEERAHHYLWRFWRAVPRAGRITIFDRSWYGRVLVERVEGFATPEQWHRAYKEINDFEEQLHQHGVILLKFWLHIDKDEQLRRFQRREEVPFKQFKISPEDYRNRSKWEAYDAAVNEMVERCSPSYAPWTLVEANFKRFARIKVLKTFCERLAERL
jgi:polyphosphate:AMP phosphotransferase